MEKYQNELLKDTLELLSFDGEEGKPLPGAPFGEVTDNASTGF